MSFVNRLKSVLGLNGSPDRGGDEPAAVTVEHEPSEPESVEDDEEPDTATAAASTEPEPVEQVEEAETSSKSASAEPDLGEDIKEPDTTTEVASAEPSREPASADTAELTDISGIGPTYAERLEAAGVSSVSALSETSSAELSDETGISEKRITGWIEQASAIAHE